MKKAMIIVLNILLLFFSCMSDKTKGAETQELKLVSQYALVYNCDEKAVIYEKNADQIMYPASLTKIMTVLVALEQESDLTKSVVVQAGALKGLVEADVSVAGFEAMEQVRFIDLLYGAMLPSGADATNMIAYDVAGSEAAFVKMMNEKAQSLHLKHTHFVNASGLHAKGHYSSAQDLLIILQEALKNDTFYQIYTSHSYTSMDQRHHFESTASKMAKAAGIDSRFLLGVKTGFTSEGGLCISFLTKVNDATYLVILGNAGNDLKTFQNVKDASQVYQYLKKHYALQMRYHAGEEIGKAKVKYGYEDEVAFCTHEDIRILTMNDNLTEEIKLIAEPLTAPIKADDPIAELTLGNTMHQYHYPLYAMKQVNRTWVADVAQAWWMFLLILIAIVYGCYDKFFKVTKNDPESSHKSTETPNKECDSETADLTVTQENKQKPPL